MFQSYMRVAEGFRKSPRRTTDARHWGALRHVADRKRAPHHEGLVNPLLAEVELQPEQFTGCKTTAIADNSIGLGRVATDDQLHG